MIKKLGNEEQMNVSGGNYSVHRSRTGGVRIRPVKRSDKAFLQSFLRENGYYKAAEKLDKHRSVIMSDVVFDNFYNQCLGEGKKLHGNLTWDATIIDDDATEEVL